MTENDKPEADGITVTKDKEAERVTVTFPKGVSALNFLPDSGVALTLTMEQWDEMGRAILALTKAEMRAGWTVVKDEIKTDIRKLLKGEAGA